MGMILTDLISEVRENVKRTTAGVSDIRIMRWLNWSQDYLADIHVYQEMKSRSTATSTVAHANSILFPTTMQHLYDMTVIDGSRSRKLTYVTFKEFDAVVPKTDAFAEGLPQWYVDYGSYFELFPIPNAVYNLPMRISSFPTAFVSPVTAPTQESNFLRKDALLVAMATTFGLYTLREIEYAAYWANNNVSMLYQASISGERDSSDWTPVARGFGDSHARVGMGAGWWTTPFSGRSLDGGSSSIMPPGVSIDGGGAI
jgi:hypothetical protein